MHLVGQSVFLKTLGWSLFNSLWQMALLWIAYMVITGAGRRFSATIRHVAAVLLLGAGSGWFVLSFGVAYFSNGDMGVAGNPVFLIFPDNRQVYSFLYAAKQFFTNALPYCSVAYITILIFFFTRYVTYYLHSRRLKIDGLHKAHPSLRIFVEELAQQLGIHKKVSVWLSSVADSPMTVGFFKSVILIPIATINHLTTSQVEAILLHELAHIKRNDYFLNLLVTVTSILFFFNPFSRLLIRQIRKETENSCDDLVMQFRYDPLTYVSALLSLEKTRRQQQLAMAAVGKNNQVLLERVKRITGHEIKPRHDNAKLVLFLLVAAITCLPALFKPHRQQETAAIVNHDQLAYAEIPLVFNMPAAPMIAYKKKSASSLKKKITAVNPNIAGEEVPMNDLTLVSNTDQDDDGDGNNDISVAVQPEADRDYSIRQGAAPVAPAAVYRPEDKFPFVPKSSFTFKIIADTIKHQGQKTITYSEQMAEASMQKTLKALDVLNWEKIGKGISGNKRAADIDKLKKELRKSMMALDWEKINNEVSEAPDEAEETRIKENIQLQVQALQNSKFKTPQEIQKLQQDIYKEKQKLFQENMRKLNENLREIEAIRKKNKIVYI